MSNHTEEFLDLYEVMEISPKATSETIERVFRYLVKRYHPDTADTADMKKFTQLVDAFEVLRDPVQRAAFDVEREANQKVNRQLVEDAGCAGDDVAERHQLLTLFYAKRRRDIRNPGVGVSTLEALVSYPVEVLDFHLWYFREKGWIDREESGLLSITAEGVDRIEATIKSQQVPEHPRLSVEKDRLHFDQVDDHSGDKMKSSKRDQLKPVGS